MGLSLFFIIALSIGIYSYLYTKKQAVNAKRIGLERFRDARVLKDMPMWRIAGCFYNEELASNSQSRVNLISLINECTGKRDYYSHQEIRRRVIHDYYAKTIDCSAPTEEEIFDKLAENQDENISFILLKVQANDVYTTIFEDLTEELFGFRSFT